jgi:hypothetical protein
MNLYDEHALSAARRADSSWLSHLTALREMPASDHPRHEARQVSGRCFSYLARNRLGV